jgi:hypothetical protein
MQEMTWGYMATNRKETNTNNIKIVGENTKPFLPLGKKGFGLL